MKCVDTSSLTGFYAQGRIGLTHFVIERCHDYRSTTPRYKDALRYAALLQEREPEADWFEAYYASTRPPARCPDAVDVALTLLRAPLAGLTRILANHLRLAAGREAKYYLPLIKLAAARGCSFRRINGDGQTFAHIVVMSGHSAALRLLHTLGVPVDQPDFWGRTPLLYAVAAKDDDCSETLIRAGANNGVCQKIPGDSTLTRSRLSL